MMCALKKWRHYAFRVVITVYTDHSSLISWQTNRDLSGRRACWDEVLAEVSVSTVHRPGQHNIVADAFSKQRDNEHNQAYVFNFSYLVERIRALFSEDK